MSPGNIVLDGMLPANSFYLTDLESDVEELYWDYESGLEHI